MYKFGPYGPNHSTAGTFAFKRKLLKETRYEDNALLAEEKDSEPASLEEAPSDQDPSRRRTLIEFRIPPEPAQFTKAAVVRVMESIQTEGPISQNLYNKVRESLGVLGVDTTELDQLFGEYQACNNQPNRSDKDAQTLEREFELAAKIALFLEKARNLKNGNSGDEYLKFLESYYQILGRCSLEYWGQDKNNGFSKLSQRIDEEIIERVGNMLATKYVEARYSMGIAKIANERGLMPLIERRYGKTPGFSEQIKLLANGGLTEGDIDRSLNVLPN